MLLGTLWQTIWQNILTHKVRSLLAIVGIIWGAYAIMMLLALGQGMFAYNQKALSLVSQPLVFVLLNPTREPYQGFGIGRQLDMSVGQVMRLPQEVSGIASVTPFAGDQKTVAANSKQVTYGVNGVTPSYFQMYPIQTRGRVLNQDDMARHRRVIVLSYQAKTHLFGKVDPLGKAVTVNGLLFTVVGFAPKVPGNNLSMNNCFIPYTTYYEIWRSRIRSFLLLLQPGVPFDAVKAHLIFSLGQQLRFSPSDKAAYTFWNFTDIAHVLHLVTWAVRLFLAFCGLMTLIVGGISIANMMVLIVQERRHEIGLHMALGAEPKHVLQWVLLETLVLVVVGSVIAAILAGLTIFGLHQAHLPEWLGRPNLDGVSILIVALVLLVTALVAGWFPARKAALMLPVEALI